MTVFVDIGLMILIAMLLAFLVRIFKQPQIPAYILSGILISALGIITNKELITAVSEIGIAFLLFTVGLELDFRKLKNIGPIAVGGGIIQFILLFSLGFLLSTLLGFETNSSMYLGLILAFSSTMVVIKLISDKKQLDTLHGKIIIGFLLMQDLIAIIAISSLTALNSNFNPLNIGISLLKGLGLLLAALLLSRYVLRKIANFAAKSQDLLFLFEIGICFLFSILYYSIGFSIAIGAFIAGISLANLPYHIEMIAKMRSLRDFFAILFFVSLGMEVGITKASIFLWPLFLFILFIFIVKPLVTMWICGFFGYTKRVSFQSSISLAQISEFSLIIVSVGFSQGQIPGEVFSMTILLAMLTMGATSYLIKYESRLYDFFSKFLGIFEIRTVKKLEYVPKEAEYDLVFCGYDRIGYSIVKSLKKRKKKFIIIDYNPDIIKELIKKKIPCMYGDIGDTEILERLNLEKTKQIISTIPELEISELLLKKAKQANPRMSVFLTAERVNDALELYRKGADYVILPHFLGGEHVSYLLDGFKDDGKKILEHKFKHMAELKKRQHIGHAHPVKH